MSNLKQIQQSFLEYLLAPNKEMTQQSMANFVVPQANISVTDRLSIYANAYRARLKQTIANDHQQLCRYLGDELFDKLAELYIQDNPSHCQSLRYFCDKLPNFLAESTFFNKQPILSELARFERCLLNTFDAPESARESYTTLQTLAHESWPECQLRFHPSVQLFSCYSNAVQCWQAIKQSITPPTAKICDRQNWLMWRSSQRITEFISLENYQTELVEAVLRGENFSNLCEIMLEYTEAEHAPRQVLQSIQAWFELGLIKDIVIS